MLGLVNLPSESVDFYAQPKNSHNSFAFFGQYKNKSTVSYTDDGRRVIDGKVEVRKEPHEMWCNLLINLFIKSIATRFDGSIRSTHERHTNDSTETPSISNAMMKPISPQIILDPKPTTLTAMSNLNLKNAMLANNETNMADKMIGVDAKNEDKETYSD